MKDKLVESTKHLAVIFCKYSEKKAQRMDFKFGFGVINAGNLNYADDVPIVIMNASNYCRR